MDKEIRLVGRLICADAAEAEVVRRHLPEHIRLTRAEEGCLQFEVTELPGTTIWEIRERFADKGAFERHQARVKDSDWGRHTTDIERRFDIDEVDPEAEDGPDAARIGGADLWPDPGADSGKGSDHASDEGPETAPDRDTGSNTDPDADSKDTPDGAGAPAATDVDDPGAVLQNDEGQAPAAGDGAPDAGTERPDAGTAAARGPDDTK